MAMTKQEPANLDRLAILGGEPVRRQPWPIWPRFDNNTETALKEVLHSGRWTITGLNTGKLAYERRFADAFAKFYDVDYCVPTTSGSTALTVALEALNVGRGEEVLVPGLTWVACAASVVSIGAFPVLCDVEPDTLCMSVNAASKAITGRTGAILLVHQNCSIANVKAFLELSRETGIPIVEDCSQAHGAKIGNQRVGRTGNLATFSMQQDKLLTCGEGGAVITSDPNLFDRAQQFHANGRRYTDSSEVGQMELEPVGVSMGNNYVLGEFQAAILLDRLSHLDEENEIRDRNVAYLISLLREIGGITSLCSGPENSQLAYHKLILRLSLDEFGSKDIGTLVKALSAELELHAIGRLDEPLNHNPLFNPKGSPRLAITGMDSGYDPARFSLPVATQAAKECIYIRHYAFLGSKEDMDSIAEGFRKVKKLAYTL
jgi:L-glutamine:scyllo-inosose aminotransferase/L-glutamine:2-deoxy-scyllo-inosose/3-amino-2,3-dideoxy-scyllo-inosose aminotransferase